MLVPGQRELPPLHREIGTLDIERLNLASCEAIDIVQWAEYYIHKYRIR